MLKCKYTFTVINAEYTFTIIFGGTSPIRTDVPGTSHRCYAYSATVP